MALIKQQKYIHLENRLKKKIYNTLPKPVNYSFREYGFEGIYTGRNVKIAIIDSGRPDHKDIKHQTEPINFCGHNKNISDKIGHSTMLSGIIKAKNSKAITGFAPRAIIYYAKVIDDSGKCNFNSLIAGILWAIVKQVDIITIALGTQLEYNVLYDTIQKAAKENIIIISAAGKVLKTEQDEPDFPARYSQVFSVSPIPKIKKYAHSTKEKVDFILPAKTWFTTYLDNQYISIPGSSISTAIVTGLSALLLERYRDRYDKDDLSKKVYTELNKIFR